MLANVKPGDEYATRCDELAICYGAIPGRKDVWAVAWLVIDESDPSSRSFDVFQTDLDGFEYPDTGESRNDIIGPWSKRHQLAGGHQ